MKKTVFILSIVLLLVFSACKQTNSNNDRLLADLERIELENSKTINEAGENISKAYVFLNDSLFYLKADMQKDHRIFGFEKPDTQSNPLLLFSIFTNDVENNPFGFELGSYYDMEESTGLKIYYQEHNEEFVEAIVIDSLDQRTTIYFEKKWIEVEEETEDLVDKLQEFGIIENIEDGAYPFYIVTVNFVEREMKVDFNLNIEAISLDVEGLFNLVGKYATIYYTSELENSLDDLQIDGASLFGEYAPDFDSDWRQITGILSGADKITPGDLPGMISISNSEGEKMDFELFIDSETVKANGKTVDAFYDIRGVNTIVQIIPSEE